MAPRRYSRRRRDDAMAQTRERILEAILALHAERGSIKTSYAAIAERADVAVPTVYKHFPNLTEMFSACVGHAVGQAPPLGPDLFDAHPDTPARLDALVRAAFAQYRFLARWLHWSQHEASLVPELAPFQGKLDDLHRQLIAAALAPRCGANPPEALAGLIEVLTRFASWETLTQARGLSHERAVAEVSRALRLLIEHDSDRPQPQSTNPSASRRSARRIHS